MCPAASAPVAASEEPTAPRAQATVVTSNAKENAATPPARKVVTLTFGHVGKQVRLLGDTHTLEDAAQALWEVKRHACRFKLRRQSAA